MDRIRVVWFDVDGTLYDFRSVMRRSLAETLELIHQRHPATRGVLSVEAMVAVREELAPLAEGSGASLHELRCEAFRETLRRYARPDDDFAEELAEVYYGFRHVSLPPYPAVVECLTALTSSYALGVLSNGNTPPEQLGLGELFTHRVYAEQVGMGKPERGIFEHAARVAGARPGGRLLVGDSPRTDIAGARAAGWRAVWFCPDGECWPLEDDPPPSFVDFGQLPDLLAQLDGGS